MANNQKNQTPPANVAPAAAASPAALVEEFKEVAPLDLPDFVPDQVKDAALASAVTAEQLEAERELRKTRRVQLSQELESVNQRIAKLDAEKNRLAAEIEPLDEEFRRPQTPAEQSINLKRHLEQQQKARLEKIARVNALADQGITPAIFNTKAPVDSNRGNRHARRRGF